MEEGEELDATCAYMQRKAEPTDKFVLNHPFAIALWELA